MQGSTLKDNARLYKLIPVHLVMSLIDLDDLRGFECRRRALAHTSVVVNLELGVASTRTSHLPGSWILISPLPLDLHLCLLLTLGYG